MGFGGVAGGQAARGAGAAGGPGGPPCEVTSEQGWWESPQHMRAPQFTHTLVSS